MIDPDWCLTPIRVFLFCLWRWIMFRLSDSSRLSDKHALHLVLLVRFFAVIGQARSTSCSACPILRGYRTSTLYILFCLSDSSRLSDKHALHLVLLVRFFAVIGRARSTSCSACPILRGYRTTCGDLVFSNFRCILRGLFPISQTVLRTVSTSRANVRNYVSRYANFVQSFH